MKHAPKGNLFSKAYLLFQPWKVQPCSLQGTIILSFSITLSLQKVLQELSYTMPHIWEKRIHNLPLHCCGTLHIHSLPTDTTSITNLYTYYNLSYERTEFKIILSTSNYMFYFLYLSRIQVKPQIFKVLEHEISDEDGNKLCIWILVFSAVFQLNYFFNFNMFDF